MIWASDDRSGDPYFWWVTARRRAHNCLEVNLWNGGVGLENWNDWSEEICEKQTVTNWLELRSWLVTKAEKLLYLPMELLDEGVRRLIRNQVAPYLAGV